MKQDALIPNQLDFNNARTSAYDRSIVELKQRSVSSDDIEFSRVHSTVQRIALDIHSNATEKFQQMLVVGMHYLNLDSAVMGSVIGNTLDIYSLAGDIAKSNSQDDTLLIDDTLFYKALHSSETIALHDVETPYPSKPNTQTTDTIQSFIGRQIDTTNGPFGLIGFHSSQARTAPFTSHHINIVTFISQSIGLIMGYEERIELISHHTEFYRPMLGIVPAMMLLCDQTGLVMAASCRLSNMLGIDSDAMPGKDIRQYIHSDDHATVNTVLEQGDVEHIPLRLHWNGNMSLDVELSSCIKSIGITQGVRIVVLVDVSDRNKAIKEVQQQNRQLTRANQSLDQFAAIASHDLQEPLRKIQQFSVFLQEDLAGLMTTDVKHHLDVILKASKRMTGLVQDVLQLSRTAQGSPELSDVKLTDLIQDVIDELEFRIEEANATITVSEMPTVRGDPGLIRQLFTNLIGNSIKYRHHSRNPDILINAVFDGDSTSIAIEDNGIGFDPDQTQTAFEPFSRLHTNAEYTGNGIGLTICEKVCDQHNWELTATSTPDIGSVFTIRIPNNV